MDLETLIGTFAAICTTGAYIPQLKKCWATGSADDLSLKMLLVLSTGISLWIVYGVLQEDWVIIGANGASLALLLAILRFKLKGRAGAAAQASSASRAQA